MLGQYPTAFAAASPAVSSFVHIPGTPKNFHAGEMTGAEVTGVLVTGAAVTGAEEATGALVTGAVEATGRGHLLRELTRRGQHHAQRRAFLPARFWFRD